MEKCLRACAARETIRKAEGTWINSEMHTPFTLKYPLYLITRDSLLPLRTFLIKVSQDIAWYYPNKSVIMINNGKHFVILSTS